MGVTVILLIFMYFLGLPVSKKQLKNVNGREYSGTARECSDGTFSAHPW